MKKLINILVLFCIIICNAQSPIKPLFMKGGSNVSGAYYKDIDNDFDSFVGTWIYINNNTSLKIVFQKKTQIYIDDYGAYYDMIIGEYQYIENGVEKVNTLPNINIEYEDTYNHNIGGYIIMKKGAAPVCLECSENERRLYLHFYDPLRPGIQKGLSGNITVKRADLEGSQKIKIFLKQTGSHIPDAGETIYNSFNVPWGEYILTKIN